MPPRNRERREEQTYAYPWKWTPPELIIILVVALLIFGPKNLPKLGQAIGRSVKGLRGGMEVTESDDDDLSTSRVDRAAKRLAEDQARERAEKAAAAHAKA